MLRVIIMVYHYTNFIYETNFWWMRRIRPIWMGATLGIGIFIFYRYYFFGKNSMIAQKNQPKQVWQKRARSNKRNWGYNAVYEPTLERSRKKLILDTLGDNYDYPVHYTEGYTATYRTIQDIMEEQNNY